MPRLLVTGTRKGRIDTAYWLDRWVRKFRRPSLVIVGDSDDWTPWQGVDGAARIWALSRGFRYHQVRCSTVLVGARRFLERDERMAEFVEEGDWCLALPDFGSRGTYYTAQKCRARGATVVVCPRHAPQVTLRMPGEAPLRGAPRPPE